jgi:predicted RNA-binding Zn-ribbon protein involved in translation (DUF1610 family)
VRGNRRSALKFESGDLRGGASTSTFAMKMKNQLQCPNCSEIIPITWGRYWKSASNYYRCPKCEESSRFATRPAWIQYASWAVQVSLLVPLYFYYKEVLAWIVMIPIYVIMFIADKRLDGRFGILVDARATKNRSEQDVHGNTH